jgi:peptidoglycan hydrolase CwlO-like protein
MENKNLVTALETLGEKIEDLTDKIRYKDMLINDLNEALAKANQKITELEDKNF